MFAVTLAVFVTESWKSTNLRIGNNLLRFVHSLGVCLFGEIAFCD